MKGRAHRTHVNGRFLSQALTGTQRYAAQVAAEMVDLDPEAVLLLPRGATAPPWWPAERVVTAPVAGQVFEQLWLPWAARRGALLSMAGPAPLLGRRQVVVMHDATPFRFPTTFSRGFVAWYRLMYRWLARTRAAVFTVSDFSRGELAAWLGTDPARFGVAACGADHMDALDAEPCAPGLTGEPFLLFVGSRAVHKNLGVLHAQFADSPLPVLVTGAAPPSRAFSQDGLREAGGAVHHLGRVTDGQLKHLYGRAFALVMPSLYEGFGLPVVEAQRCGALVVTSDRASLPEVTGDGGVLVDPGEPGGFRRAVEALLADPGLAGALRERGRANSDRFTWRGSARVLHAACREAAGAGTGVAVGVSEASGALVAGAAR